jgi:hypothetical protein
MLDTYMNPIDAFDSTLDDIIPPIGFEFSLSRDDDMIVWKKALKTELKRHGSRFNPEFYEPVIVKLKIPKDASVLFTPKKCRASRAIVLGFYPCAYGGEEYELDITSAMAWYDHSFKYNLGEEITPDCFDHDWRNTCSHGINFFRNFDEAVNYVF